MSTPPAASRRTRGAALPGRSAKASGVADEPPARVTLTPDNWIAAATEVLVDEGIDSVRVDVLSQHLKVTRGSFYHHFRDRDELLRRLMQAWREGATEQLTRRLEQASADPREQLRDVLSLPFRGRSAQRGARIELALRAWARRDALARQFVDEADSSRMAYIAQVFSSLGFPLMEARSRAYLLYSYLLGESIMNTQATERQRQDRSNFVERLLQRRLGDG